MQTKHQNIRRLLAHLRDYTILVVLTIAGFLIIFGFVTVAQNRKQQGSLDKQVAITNQLVAQVKALSEENKKLSQTAANYAYCNALILANYTQTNSPISIDDLDKCRFTSYPNDTFTVPADSQAYTLQPSAAPTQAGDNAISVADNQGNQAPAQGMGNGTNTPPANSGSTPTEPPPTQTTPVIALQPTLLLPGLTATVPCIGLQGLLTIGCQ